MTLPFTKREIVWTDKAVTATAILDDQLTRMCPIKVIEIITTAFSGTLDIQGRIMPTATLDNVSYARLGQGVAQAASSAQLSWTTDTARYRYLVTEPYMDMSLVMTRSAGSITVNVGGWGLSGIQSAATLTKLAAGTDIIGQTGIDQTTLGTTNGVAMLIRRTDSIYTPAQAEATLGDAYDGFAFSTVATRIFNGTNYDRVRGIASSGAGLGVQKVGTLGELITLAASAARTESANGTAVTGLGWRNRYLILFDLTVADTDAGDTLDVYVDVSLDGSTWLNAVHFTQIIGTDAASKRFAVLDPSAPGTAEILVTTDAAAGVVRPSLFGAQMRARWAIVDAGTDDASFTFSVTAYAI